MKKTFCDKCGDEIKVDSEWVLGKELCPVCTEIISDWLDGKTLELGCETDDKPIITDPECCGDCFKCTHFRTHGDTVEMKTIVACMHYKKRLYFELGDIMVGSVTPITFKDYGEAIKTLKDYCEQRASSGDHVTVNELKRKFDIN